MANKGDLQSWVRDALNSLGGSAPLIEVAKQIWKNHEIELRGSNDLFFSWQYDMRWAANRLRRTGVMKSAESSPSGIWELSK